MSASFCSIGLITDDPVIEAVDVKVDAIDDVKDYVKMVWRDDSDTSDDESVTVVGSEGSISTEVVAKKNFLKCVMECMEFSVGNRLFRLLLPESPVLIQASASLPPLCPRFVEVF